MKHKKLAAILVVAGGIFVAGTIFVATQFTGKIRTAITYPAPNVAAVAIDFPDKISSNGLTTQTSFVNKEIGDTYQFPDEHRPLIEYPPESIQETYFSFSFWPVRTETYEVTKETGEKIKCQITIYGDGRSVTKYLDP